MVTVTGICDGDGNGNGDRVGNNNGYGDSDSNGHGNGKGDDDEGRVAFSCAGNVQCYGRGDTLPLPTWTQRSVHSPALRHGGDLQRVFAPFQGGGFLTAHHGFFCLFFTTTVQFTEQTSVCPLHYSGAQEPCQPIDALPPPLLQEPRQPIDDLPWLTLHFLSR